MQAFAAFFHVYHLDWMVKIIAFLTTIGALGMVSTWIIGPSKGLLAAAHHGDIPPFFQKMNRKHAPTTLLILQGVIVTALSFIFLFMPTVSASYWILTDLTAQLYLLMYVLMFLAALRLRYKSPNTPRSYRVPGGNIGMWVVAGVGLIGSLFAIAMGFVPPKDLDQKTFILYEVFLGAGIVVMFIIPLIISLFKKPSWRADHELQ